MIKDGIEYADDNTESIKTLFKLRIPSLFLGLILGIILSFLTSRFEQVLMKNIEIAFFIPFVVYVADAVGSQTQGIYSGGLRLGKAKFFKYLLKESALGLVFGLIFGAIIFSIVALWFSSVALALTVALSSFFAVATAPIISLFVTEILQLIRKDPAANSGPITTVIQDTASILIYGFIASALIL
ncbi:MAG: magnesium transporter [Candidatus Pacebacteria bacterium]|nr:magnesium transporter [Candidatus Paceibacterota bacterium]